MRSYLIQMKTLLILFCIYFALAPAAIAYPQDQFEDCVLSAKSNPVMEGVPESSIESFCDCALKQIIDKGKNEQNSANKCAKQSFKE